MPLPAEHELSQRGRTLLYAGVAALIATAHGVGRVTLGENGILAINSPLTGGRYGPFSTHTAHPTVLAEMATAFSQALGAQVQIDNPLLLLTKTEVLRELDRERLSPVVPLTHSCWIARQAVHCGTCVPCLVRRIAAERARVTDAPYRFDLLSAAWDPAAPHSENLSDLVTFARNVSSLGDLELLVQYGELAVPPAVAPRDDVLRMHRRWADDVLSVVRSHPAVAALAA